MARNRGKHVACRHQAAKSTLVARIAAFLFCLTLITGHLTSRLYAKYLHTSSGQDAAGVIAFGTLTLEEEGDFYEGNRLMIIPGVDITKKATVSFTGSEATVYVFAEVIVPRWTTADRQTFSLPVNGKTAMQWSVAEGWIFLKAVDGTYLYYRVLSPNTTLVKEDILADGGRITVSDQLTKSDVETMTDVSIRLRATVIQAGGFESPEAAWDSVAAKEG